MFGAQGSACTDAPLGMYNELCVEKKCEPDIVNNIAGTTCQVRVSNIYDGDVKSPT